VALRGGPLFTFRQIPVIGAMLARRGIDVAELLAEAELPASAARGEITAPLSRVQGFITLCAARLDAPLFGIDLATSLPGGVYGVAEFLVRSAASVEVALGAIAEFGALINPSGRFTFVDGRLVYTFAAERDTLGMHLNEYTFSYIVRQFGNVLGAPIPLAGVWFSHSRADGAEAVAKHFGCAVRFQARDSGFAVTADGLALAPRTADPLLYQFLLDQARAQLARIGAVDIVSQVIRVLEMRMPSGELDAASTARALALSPRTLQRHLEEAGTKYTDVLAHVRQRLRAELRSGGVAEPEIARRLGFSDARAMRRSLDE
jgi:AraC-like DNA-binding protein